MATLVSRLRTPDLQTAQVRKNLFPIPISSILSSSDSYVCVFITYSIHVPLIYANSFSARSGGSPASNWIAPVERYVVVPDETLGPLAIRLHQTANVSSSEPKRDIYF
jgi:hypothetical protein